MAKGGGVVLALRAVGMEDQRTGFYGCVSLYVGDLHRSVNEAQLYDLFSQIGPVMSIRVCRDKTRHFSLGYAYVNYINGQHAMKALNDLNFTPVCGKPIRIMFSNRDPSMRKSGLANVFIKNLDTSIDNKTLHETFSSFGTVLSCKVVSDDNGQSRGYGFVQFDHEEAAHNAIQNLNGTLFNGKKAYVGLFVRKLERDQVNGVAKFTNVYVKNLSATTSDEDLKKVFGVYGPITSSVVMRDATGNSRGFGFVNFENPEDAASAVKKLNGKTEDDKVWYVGKAQRKSEREAQLRAKYEQERKNRFEKLQGANLYLKNIEETIDDQKLKELFSKFGTVTSCKVMLHMNGQSKGSGFVAFSTPKEANRALYEMNGKMIGRKPLYVAVAQRKEERRAILQAHFAQIQSTGTMSPVPLGIPAFHPVGNRLGAQQLYYGQGSPALLPLHSAGFAYPQQIVPSGGGVNFMIPYHLQGQFAQRGGLRRGLISQQLQQQQLQRNFSQERVSYMPSTRNGIGPSAVLPNGVPPVAVIGAPRTGPGGPVPLASALASADRDQQHMMLGQQLFPLVAGTGTENAGKVTGMLLEMDQTEVLHLIESPDALNKKVGEALQVIQSATDSGSDHVASLSLTD